MLGLVGNPKDRFSRVTAQIYLCVFHYIQGSGKTYTVGGGHISSLTEDEYGIIPRAVKQMFDIMQVSTVNILKF